MKQIIIKISLKFHFTCLGVEEIGHGHGWIKQCGLEQPEEPGLLRKDGRAAWAFMRWGDVLVFITETLLTLHPQYGAGLGVVVDWGALTVRRSLHLLHDKQD